MREEIDTGSQEPRVTADLIQRSRAYALRVVRLYVSLPKGTEVQVNGKQLLRSGTSVGAHYAEAKRAKSDRDFINKIEGALQELEETDYWLSLLADAQIVSEEKLASLRQETNELIAIFVTIVKKVKAKR